MPDKETVFLSINNATIRHLDKTLFKSLSFQIEENEHWAILGKSGSGKSAFLYTILGDFNVINGSIKYPGFEHFKQIHQIADPLFTNRRLISLVSQQAHFKNKQNMRDFFYQQRFHSWFAEEADTVEKYLQDQWNTIRPELQSTDIRFSLEWVTEHLQLKTLLPKTLIQLSNGETRRLMIAHALLKQPLLLMLDNPFIGLDTATRPVLEKLLSKITQKKTHLLLATTRREIPECITHIAELEAGELIQTSPKAAFVSKANSEKNITRWQPDADVLSAIQASAPKQDHSFELAIKVENARVKYGENEILKNIFWEVKKGEKWALTGPNGAGKSTLLSLLTGDHPQAYANTIYLLDRKRGSGESIWEIKHRIGFVSPEMHQYFRGNGNCTEVICSGLNDTMGFKRQNIPEAEQNMARNWLKLLGLEHLQDTRYKDAAAGEQRLLLLLRALAKNPPLLILDEPCQGLDEAQKGHLKEVINRLWSGPDKSLLYVSHYKEDIPECVNHLLQLEAGKVKHSGLI